ncbi:Nif3-like dinuclear metal center hexameric protein [Candidatus Woesearchaeota archaeon]|nr:Nif3-like dinuclear metal center hexameric protein [Candidatus Woesearchaeota archaeon]
MGLVCDNSAEIGKVYTAVFPSDDVLKKILKSGEKDALLFLHHPMVWDIQVVPSVKSMNRGLLRKFKENRISIYALHTPLDKVGEYSTCVSLAKAIGLTVEKAFYPYYNQPSGVICKSGYDTREELAKQVQKVVGHKVKLWDYGWDKIADHKVAVIGGGGNDMNALKEMSALGINTFVTGVTRPSKDHHPALEAHEFAKKNKINIIGATHYSTEKFACIAMVDYFKKLGLKAEFVPDKPDFEDVDYGFNG